MLRLASLALVAGILGAPLCAQDIASARGMEGFITVDRLPEPDHPVLSYGREVWGGTCYRCHGGDKLTGAPKITSTKAWAPRIEQGFEVLSDHALNGFVGPKYTEMPARGGNSDLSDADVMSAIAFMVWASGGADAALAFADTITRDK